MLKCVIRGVTNGYHEIVQQTFGCVVFAVKAQQKKKGRALCFIGDIWTKKVLAFRCDIWSEWKELEKVI